MIKGLDLSSDSISNIYTKNIKLREPFIEFASKFAEEVGTVVLLSNKKLSGCSRYDILGYAPWLSFTGKDCKMKIKINNQSIEFEADPFDTLQYLLEIYDISNFVKTDAIINSGLIGYLAYDLKNRLEVLPITTIDDSYLPDICFFIPTIIVVNDILKDEVKVFISSNKNGNVQNQKKIIKNFYKKIESSTSLNNNISLSNTGYKSNFSYREYIDSVKKIRAYISKGHVYQVNLSQRFHATFEGRGFSFFKELYYNNPASFFAYINAMDHQIISSSPERLIMQRDRKIETRPIKGTRPRGKNGKVDKLMIAELLNSKKDDAELSMIVDLLRNDLGKVCTTDSVSVYKHKKLETYKNVHHLVSIIKGTLEDSKNSVDLIKAVFPGGSITGCPKIRAMEIIDELERNCRHVYTGSIGYISFHKTMDLSVAIRTAIIFNNIMHFSVGGGVIYDSDPEEEYKETLYKGQTIMRCFDNEKNILNKDQRSNDFWGWINGILKPLDNISIPINDLGLMYGFGIFETLCVKNGYIYFLKEHIERFNISWTKLFKTPAPKLYWHDIIISVVKANKLDKDISALKILATKGKIENGNKNFYRGTILVTAKPYKNRLMYSKKGFKVIIYPNSRQTPLASYKTLNYLYYYIAGLWAKNLGFDEAIILNPDNTVSEGNSSNIFLIYNEDIIVPESKFVLKGVTGGVVIKQFKKMNYNIIKRPVKKEELSEADAVFMTNSLIGAVPVISINNKPINLKNELVDIINKKIFSFK